MLVSETSALNGSEISINFLVVLFLSADLIPLDLDYRIEGIIAMQPNAHIYMSADVSSLANTGFIIVRNSRWARGFLRDWLARRHQPGIQTEQLGFETLYYTRDVGEMREKVAVLPAHVMNSIAAPMGEQQPHHKVGLSLCMLFLLRLWWNDYLLTVHILRIALL
jgi:hypothetical protein